MKTNDDFTQKNIELSTEYSRYLFEHPELEEKLPVDAELIFLPEFDAELKVHNLKMGRDIEAQGRKVTYLSLTKMRPKKISRIEGLAVAP